MVAISTFSTKRVEISIGMQLKNTILCLRVECIKGGSNYSFIYREKWIRFGGQ